MRLRFPTYKTVLVSLLALFTLYSAISVLMRFPLSTPSLFPALSYFSRGESQTGSTPSSDAPCNSTNATVNLGWHPPINSNVNSLQSAINGTGTYGFVFNSSQGPPSTYNWCNMPHTNPSTYPRINSSSYKLVYVEVIHRHHKRTPYAANTFPVEHSSWHCDDAALFYGGKPLNPPGNGSASTYWTVSTPPSHPLVPQGFPGNCQFPQITREGLDDSHQHGVDLKAVYSDLLAFLPQEYDGDVTTYRVTNNVITSQVASMLIAGTYPARANSATPLLIQPPSIDSLEPSYPCPAARKLTSTYGPGSTSPAWQAHLTASTPLFARLDAVSGVSPNASAWHTSLDHYFDNLSARLCHGKPLPCKKSGETADCVTLADAERVFRLGEYEYSRLYRDTPDSLAASAAAFGIWVAELARNLRDAMDGDDRPRYRHNIAHDGSLARLLSILQIEEMVWPGMGAEVVFELYYNHSQRPGNFYLRVLWGGQVMRSSQPAFRGAFDMVPVETVLEYFDGLVGVGGSKVVGDCEMVL
ncbi:hypothetical protein LTR08_003018 [Meristemomyces frigidus]|nr:hypothetical protein LTR08_003018 [Meristemomyces frigidus]